MKVYCAVCTEELTEPGALYFSPPRNITEVTSTVTKMHLCVDNGCYLEVEKALFALREGRG